MALKDVGHIGPNYYGAYDMGAEVAEWVGGYGRFPGRELGPCLMKGKAGLCKLIDDILYTIEDIGPNIGFRYSSLYVESMETGIGWGNVPFDYSDMTLVGDSEVYIIWGIEKTENYSMIESAFWSGRWDSPITGSPYARSVINFPDVRQNGYRVSSNYGIAYNGYSRHENSTHLYIADAKYSIPALPAMGHVKDKFYIKKNLVTAKEYCEFLNVVANGKHNGRKLRPTYTNPEFHSNEFWNAQMQYGENASIVRTCVDQENRVNGSNENIVFKYFVIPGMENKPITNVSFKQAQYYCNWVDNGKRDDLMPNAIRRGNNARLPQFNEWYKAAYYKGGSLNAGYWDYGNSSNSPSGFTEPLDHPIKDVIISRPIYKEYNWKNDYLIADAYEKSGLNVRDFLLSLDRAAYENTQGLVAAQYTLSGIESPSWIRDGAGEKITEITLTQKAFEYIIIKNSKKEYVQPRQYSAGGYRIPLWHNHQWNEPFGRAYQVTDYLKRRRYARYGVGGRNDPTGGAAYDNISYEFEKRVDSLSVSTLSYPIVMLDPATGLTEEETEENYEPTPGNEENHYFIRSVREVMNKWKDTIPDQIKKWWDTLKMCRPVWEQSIGTGEWYRKDGYPCEPYPKTADPPTIYKIEVDLRGQKLGTVIDEESMEITLEWNSPDQTGDGGYGYRAPLSNYKPPRSYIKESPITSYVIEYIEKEVYETQTEFYNPPGEYDGSTLVDAKWPPPREKNGEEITYTITTDGAVVFHEHDKYFLRAVNLDKNATYDITNPDEIFGPSSGGINDDYDGTKSKNSVTKATLFKSKVNTTYVDDLGRWQTEPEQADVPYPEYFFKTEFNIFKPGTEYYFRIASFNEGGIGDWYYFEEPILTLGEKPPEPEPEPEDEFSEYGTSIETINSAIDSYYLELESIEGLDVDMLVVLDESTGQQGQIEENTKIIEIDKENKKIKLNSPVTISSNTILLSGKYSISGNDITDVFRVGVREINFVGWEGLLEDIADIIPKSIGKWKHISQPQFNAQSIVAIGEDDYLYYWGRETNGEPWRIFSEDDLLKTKRWFKGFAISNNYFAIDADGNLYGWGSNVSGKVGLGYRGGGLSGKPEIVGVPTRIEINDGPFKSVSGGLNNIYALTYGGNVYQWGNDSIVPLQVFRENTWKKIVVFWHGQKRRDIIYFLSKDGLLVKSGKNIVNPPDNSSGWRDVFPYFGITEKGNLYRLESDVETYHPMFSRFISLQSGLVYKVEEPKLVRNSSDFIDFFNIDLGWGNTLNYLIKEDGNVEFFGRTTGYFNVGDGYNESVPDEKKYIIKGLNGKNIKGIGGSYFATYFYGSNIGKPVPLYEKNKLIEKFEFKVYNENQWHLNQFTDEFEYLVSVRSFYDQRATAAAYRGPRVTKLEIRQVLEDRTILLDVGLKVPFESFEVKALKVLFNKDSNEVFIALVEWNTRSYYEFPKIRIYKFNLDTNNWSELGNGLISFEYLSSLRYLDVHLDIKIIEDDLFIAVGIPYVVNGNGAFNLFKKDLNSSRFDLIFEHYGSNDEKLVGSEVAISNNKEFVFSNGVLSGNPRPVHMDVYDLRSKERKRRYQILGKQRRGGIRNFNSFESFFSETFDFVYSDFGTSYTNYTHAFKNIINNEIIYPMNLSYVKSSLTCAGVSYSDPKRALFYVRDNSIATDTYVLYGYQWNGIIWEYLFEPFEVRESSPQHQMAKIILSKDGEKISLMENYYRNGVSFTSIKIIEINEAK